jgi:trimethyllysine dioxygenase
MVLSSLGRAVFEPLLKLIIFSGGFWDFTSDLAKGDTAYTDLAIGPHTDNTYFTDPAGLQMFHLLSHEDGDGGMSGIFDGFEAANAMYQRHPEQYAILFHVLVETHASGSSGMSIQPSLASPVFCHENMAGRLMQIRWNPADRTSIKLKLDKIHLWYEAAA